MVIGMGTLSVLVLVQDEGNITSGYLFTIALFALGYRTLSLSIFTIHPLIIIVSGLFVLLIFRQKTSYDNFEIHIPYILRIIFLLSVIGLILGYANSNSLRDTITIFVNFSLILPIFALTSYVLSQEKIWRITTTLFFAVGTYIAIFGIIEFLFPQTTANLLPGFIRTAQTSTGPDVVGFERARFVFFGQPAAAFICFLALPLAIPLLYYYKSIFARLSVTVLAGLLVYAIYIAGWRSIWIGTALLFGLLSVSVSISQRQPFILLLTAGILLSVYYFLPDIAIDRTDTLLRAVEGNAIDSSSQNRIDRISITTELILSNPLGIGWGDSFTSWSHSDFVTITAALGIHGGLLFFGWYITSLISMLLVYQKTNSMLDLGLSGSFFACGALLATQPTFILTQFTVPVFFVWAMVQVRLHEEAQKRQNVNPTNRAAPNIQLRNASA